jgi:hypothetical protein
MTILGLPVTCGICGGPVTVVDNAMLDTKYAVRSLAYCEECQRHWVLSVSMREAQPYEWMPHYVSGTQLMKPGSRTG